MEFPVTYEITPKYKKSVEEIELWRNEEGNTFRTEVMWRSGTYLVHIQDADEMDMLQNAYDDEDALELDDFSEFELVDTWDSCYENYALLDKEGNELDPEEDTYAQELLEAYEEDWSDALYERGFDSEDLYTTIYNGFNMELVKE